MNKIVFCKTKGGTGATMLACNCAAMRSKSIDLFFIDGDDQETATQFTAMRNETTDDNAGYTTAQITEKALRTESLKLSKHYEIIIDTGGRDTKSLRAALSIATKAIIPFVPAAFDMWTYNIIEEIVEEAQQINPDLEAFSVLNKIDAPRNSNGELKYSSDTETAINFLKYIDSDKEKGERTTIKYLHAPIVYRKAFRDASADGLSVVEVDKKDKKAISEITALYDKIFN